MNAWTAVHRSRSECSHVTIDIHHEDNEHEFSDDYGQADIESNNDEFEDLDDLSPPPEKRQRLSSSKSNTNSIVNNSTNQLFWLTNDLKKLSENDRMLVLLDECDHLVQQEHFQFWLQ